ncbi:MAG: AI-2E family transporter [Candidatus Paceibacterota bacterium]|jgi:predicted PurR-regulated permease PerM
MAKKEITSISTGTIVRFILVIALVFILYYLRNLVLVLLTSIVLASFVKIAARRVEKWKINRVLGVTLIYVITISILIGLFYVFIPVFVDEISNFVSQISKYLPPDNILNTFQSSNISNAQDVFSKLSSNSSLSDIILSAKNLIAGLSSGFIGTFIAVFGGLVNLILIIVFSFLLSIQEDGIENFLRVVIPLKHEEYAIDLWKRSQRKIALWVRGQFLLGLIVGVLIYLGLAIFDIKYALMISLIAAIGELIPFGIYLAMVPALLFAFLDGGMAMTLIVLGLFFIVIQFEHYLLNPLVVKKVVGIPPIVVILSILIGWELAGFWGVVLAVPVSVVLLEFTGDIEKKKIKVAE